MDTLGPLKCVLVREVSSFQECPLRGVPLYFTGAMITGDTLS